MAAPNAQSGGRCDYPVHKQGEYEKIIAILGSSRGSVKQEVETERLKNILVPRFGSPRNDAPQLLPGVDSRTCGSYEEKSPPPSRVEATIRNVSRRFRERLSSHRNPSPCATDPPWINDPTARTRYQAEAASVTSSPTVLSRFGKVRVPWVLLFVLCRSIADPFVFWGIFFLPDRSEVFLPEIPVAVAYGRR